MSSPLHNEILNYLQRYRRYCGCALQHGIRYFDLWHYRPLSCICHIYSILLFAVLRHPIVFYPFPHIPDYIVKSVLILWSKASTGAVHLYPSSFVLDLGNSPCHMLHLCSPLGINLFWHLHMATLATTGGRSHSISVGNYQ